MRIAMVSEHASPLAVLGGVDAGGQNVHVAALASALARRGDTVVVHTRRDDPRPARSVALTRGVEVDHVDAGPPAQIPKDELLRHMPAFADDLREQWLDERPDVVHTHFWMSALAALEAADGLGIPIVHTFHALGTVKRRHQGDARHQPAGADRARARDRALGRPDRRHLQRRGLRAAADGRGPAPDLGRPVRRRPRALHRERPGRAPRRARACWPPAGWSSARAWPTR